MVVCTSEGRCPSLQCQEKAWKIFSVDAELARIIAFDLKMQWYFKA